MPLTSVPSPRDRSRRFLRAAALGLIALAAFAAPSQAAPRPSPPAPPSSDAAQAQPARTADGAATAVPAGDARVYSPRGLMKIRLKPDRDAPIIGAVRAGQGVKLRNEPLTELLRKHNRMFNCSEGWYAVEPRGWVCVGGPGHGGEYYGTFDASDPGVVAGRASLPDVENAYSFHFGVSVGAPRYKRIPTPAEQRQLEPDLDKHLASLPADDPMKGGAIDATQAGHGPSAEIERHFGASSELFDAEMSAYEGFKLAWRSEFDANGRTWLLTPDMTLVPKDKVRQKPLPTLQGIDLRKQPEVTLPLAFTWLSDVPKFEGTDGKLTQTSNVIPRHSFVPATTKMGRGPGGVYWQMGDGSWVKYQDVTMIRKADHRPPKVGPKDKWVEVRVTWGYLIAYEGDTPVYVTAMSPGVDGIEPKGKHQTRRGSYFIGWKMLSADMSGRDHGKDWYVDEVPWVQYYEGNYALHGAWWHNDFGRPKSHGCVNLSPPDALALFHWMDPQMPDDWYAVTSYQPKVQGTLVFLRH